MKLIFSGGQTRSASSAASSAAVAAAGSAASLDPLAKDVISNLLLFNPNMRLGMRHDGVNGIWGHPCFKGLSLCIYFVCVWHIADILVVDRVRRVPPRQGGRTLLEGPIHVSAPSDSENSYR